MFVAAIDASRESVQISLQISEFKRVTFFSLENFGFLIISGEMLITSLKFT